MAPLFTAKQTPPRGESFVWLCATGLALGLTLVAGLLGLIVSQGLSVFWPRPVVEFQLKDGSKVAGEIARTQKRHDGTLEWQLHTGNKDAWGQAYRFVAASNMASESRPADYLVAERTEYGNAIFRPVTLVLENGTVLPASDRGFAAKLAEQVAAAGARRDEIESIEKQQIGELNRKMASCESAIRAAARKGGAGEAGAAAARAEVAALQQDYEKLAARAKSLRAEQGRALLQGKLASGEERSWKVGDIVSFYSPNELDWGGRVRLFFARIWEFLSDAPREANTEGGIFPAIFGTFIMTVMMSVLVTPFGVIAAIYLREYARQGLVVRAVRISVNNLAGVPSIVFGVFGLGFFVYTVGGAIDRQFFADSLPAPTFGTGGIFWAALTLSLLTLPVVIVATEEALVAVPRGIREAALAAGASKWQMIQRVVLPSAVPGILTGVVLAMARGAGEVAPLMLVGVVKLAPSLPLDGIPPFFHLDRKFMHLGFHIYDLGFQSPDSDAARPMVFATALLLILLVVLMNLAAILLRNKLRKRYALGTF